MSSSPAISNKNAKARERRAHPRQGLKHYVVLLFFGEDNWGKLANMSESGMCFEFSKAPSLGERINFSFQVMGCMPMPPDGRGLGESFEAAGEVIWTRDFERVAGVQFVDLPEGSRAQIRQWLSFEASMGAPVSGEEAVEESTAIETEALAPLTAAEPLSMEEANEDFSELESPQSFAEPTQELEPAWPVEIPAFEEQAPRIQERRQLARPQQSNPVIARLTFMVVAGCLAAFVVTAGVKLIMSRSAHPSDVVEPVSGSASAASDPSGAGRFSSPASSPGSAAPFQVEVTDASGKRWVLWFARNGSKNGADQVASSSAMPRDFAESVSKANSKRKETAPAEESQPPKTFTLVAPIRPASNASAAGNLPADAPAIPTDLTVPSRDPIGGALPNPAAPVAEAVVPDSRPVGGMVQQARLLRSVPPIYPSIAKATRVSGDVVVDALIDAKGTVTSVKIISGPVLLQQAAIQTVRQWKYEPAKLDGQPVAMHLSVTVKFRIN